MHRRIAILSFAFLPALAIAQDRVPGQIVGTAASAPADTVDIDPRQAQIQAATTNAIAVLRDQIAQMPLGRNLHVADFLKQTQADDELTKIVQTAQPIGGPRWVDDNTCQIRVELNSSKIAAMLTAIANDPARHSPLSSSAIKTKLARWTQLKFCAAGSSAGGQSIELARPGDASGKWVGIGETVRKAAVARAHADAIAQLLYRMNPIVLSGETHAKDALAQPMIADQLTAWLDRQPVTKIEFLDDLNVTVTISIAPQSLTNAFKSSLRHDPIFSHNLHVDWDQVCTAMTALPASVAGTASAAPEVPTTLPLTILPLQPPDWIDQNLEADATATGTGSRLKIGHTAEARAVEKIRDKFLALHIDARTTLEDAARKDPQLNHAIDRSLLAAHTAHVEYLSDGSVKVRVSLDLREAWDELRR